MLPITGKVVVVDDLEEEGIPLVKTLVKDGYPTVYYTGELEQLPENPDIGVRLVFLDIQLGTSGTDEKTIISTAIGVFQKIIGLKNGPFFLVAWTGRSDLYKALLEALKEANYQFQSICLKKTDVQEDGEYSPDLIQSEVERILEEQKSFDFLFLWEKTNKDAISRAINRIYELSPEIKIGEINSIIKKLAESYSGKEELNDDGVVRSSFFCMNHILFDVLEETVGLREAYEYPIPAEGISELADNIIPGLNSCFIISKDYDENPKPGMLYKITQSISLEDRLICLDGKKTADKFKRNSDITEDVWDIGNNRIKSDFKDSFIAYLTELIPVIVVVTPVCDYAQQKQVTHRIVKGILVKKSIENKYEIKRRCGYIFESPSFNFDEEEVYFHLDYRYFSSRKGFSSFEPLFRIRKQYLFDIQSKLAAHVYRPGTISIR